MPQSFHHVVVCWPPSTTAMSCTGKARSGHSPPGQSRRIPCLNLLAKLLLVQPKRLLGTCATRTHCWLTSAWYPPGAPAFFLQNCFPSGQTAEYPSAWIYFFPGGRLHTLVNIVWFLVTTSPACQDPLKGSTTLWCISHSSQLYIIHRASLRPK